MKRSVLCLVACLLVGARGQTSCPSRLENMVQLNSESVFSTGAGRVEICVCSGSINDTCYWQTVSTGSTTEPMSWKNSIVVCRELGYFDAQSPILQNTVRDSLHASSVVDIYPTTFVCDGTESALIDCATGSSTSTLPHTTDAYVNCATVPISHRVRLTGTTTQDNGVVQFYTSGVWYSICPDFWTNTEANLTCTSLGYISGTAASYSTLNFRGSGVAATPAIQSVSCSDTALFFSSCDLTFDASCTSTSTLAGAVCVPSTGQAEGSVRLFYTANPDSYERVEVYYNGRWGTVCDTVWSLEEGQVACRELGNDADLTVVPDSSVEFNSLSSRPIWVYSYNCDGSESSLLECDRNSFAIGFVSTEICLHSDDAGATCFASSSESSGGLSGGAIAGIVIGVVVFVFIVVWFFGAQDKMKKRKLAQRQQAQQQIRTQAAVELATVSQRSNQQAQATTTVSQQSNQQNESETIPTPANPTFSQAPPPAYNEAIKQLDVQEPPQYPDEEKKVPYPVSSNYDPAYPSAPPGPNDYQGYPPPTQSAGFVLPGAVSSPQHVNPPPSGLVPYPPTASNLSYPPPPNSNLPYPVAGDGNLPYPPPPVGPPTENNLPYPATAGGLPYPS